MRRTTLIGLAALIVIVGQASGRPPAARAVTRIGEFSSQVSGNRALVGARISVRVPRSSAGGSQPPASGDGPLPPSDQVVLPSLAAGSPLLQNPAPAGPGSLWYQSSPGESCIYIPTASPDCYMIVAKGFARPPDLASIATSLAEQLELSLAPIEASPAANRDGLAGAPSWFWLSDPPGEEQRSISLAGETVTVSADPSPLSWSFGDGAAPSSGPNIFDWAAGAPADAVRHLYETRCLPGDQGHDPYVLPSCEDDGYHVSASTIWTITFTASGPVDQNGQLASRTTSSGLVYPVSEARAFLTGGQG